MNYSFDTLFLLFIIYSFLGWLIEIINEIVTCHSVVAESAFRILRDRGADNFPLPGGYPQRRAAQAQEGGDGDWQVQHARGN